MIRVGFPLIGGKGWTGGYNYLLNLVRVVGAHAGDRITPVLLFGPEASEAEVAPFRAVPGAEIVTDPAFGSLGRARRLARALAVGLDAEAARVFRRADIQVVFEAAQFFGWRLGVPALAWIPDFQHKHLPQLFSRAALLKRDIGFETQIRSGRRIMLSSEDARADCERFHPASRGRTAVVRFAIPRDQPVTAEEAKEAQLRHGLPDGFFFLPNQFWKHKNHAVVIEALGRIRAEGGAAVVAASGGQLDPRDPDHFNTLMARAKALGVQDQFRPLGLIPYADIPRLMRASAALINPSRFEGWSTTVEEAKATGTPMILSDLGVHREQAAGEAQFFPPEDADALARLMTDWRALPNAARNDAASEAAARSLSSAIAFADAFATAVESQTRR